MKTWRIFAVALAFKFHLWCTRWVYLLDLPIQCCAWRSFNKSWHSCMHNNCKRSLQNILKEFHLQNYIWFSLFQALWIQRLGLGVRGLRLPSHCYCSTQHLLWRLLQLPVLSWLLNILIIQIFKILFTASKQLPKFLRLLVCSPKGAKDILFPWLSDYPNEHYPSKHHSNATAPKKPSSQALLNSTNDQFKLFLMITHRRLGKIQENTFSRTQRHRVYGKMETTWLHFTTSPTF